MFPDVDFISRRFSRNFVQGKFWELLLVDYRIATRSGNDELDYNKLLDSENTKYLKDFLKSSIKSF